MTKEVGMRRGLVSVVDVVDDMMFPELRGQGRDGQGNAGRQGKRLRKVKLVRHDGKG